MNPKPLNPLGFIRRGDIHFSPSPWWLEAWWNQHWILITSSFSLWSVHVIVVVVFCCCCVSVLVLCCRRSTKTCLYDMLLESAHLLNYIGANIPPTYQMTLQTFNCLFHIFSDCLLNGYYCFVMWDYLPTCEFIINETMIKYLRTSEHISACYTQF